MEDLPKFGQHLQRWLIPAENKEKIMSEVLSRHGINSGGDVFLGYETLAKKYYLQSEWVEEIKQLADKLNKEYLT